MCKHDLIAKLNLIGSSSKKLLNFGNLSFCCNLFSSMRKESIAFSTKSTEAGGYEWHKRTLFYIIEERVDCTDVSFLLHFSYVRQVNSGSYNIWPMGIILLSQSRLFSLWSKNFWHINPLWCWQFWLLVLDGILLLSMLSVLSSFKISAVRYFISLCLVMTNPPLWQEKVCCKVNGHSHTHCEGNLLRGMSYRILIASKNACFSKKNPCFLIGRTMSHMMLHFRTKLRLNLTLIYLLFLILFHLMIFV